MAATTVFELRRIWDFVHAKTGVPLSTTMKGLGLERDGKLVCGVLYENWNKHNVWMHVAIEPGAHLTREFIRACFEYPFVQVGVTRVSGWVEESNLAARRFDEHLGFRLETRLTGAASDGGDVLIYVMRPRGCRYLPAAASMAPCDNLESTS